MTIVKCSGNPETANESLCSVACLIQGVNVMFVMCGVLQTTVNGVMCVLCYTYHHVCIYADVCGGGRG